MDNTYLNLTFYPNNTAKDMKILFMENFIQNAIYDNFVTAAYNRQSNEPII